MELVGAADGVGKAVSSEPVSGLFLLLTWHFIIQFNTLSHYIWIENRESGLLRQVYLQHTSILVSAFNCELVEHTAHGE